MIVCIRLHYIYENKILPYVIVGFACRCCCYLKKQTIHEMMSFEVMEINIYSEQVNSISYKIHTLSLSSFFFIQILPFRLNIIYE